MLFCDSRFASKIVNIEQISAVKDRQKGQHGKKIPGQPGMEGETWRAGRAGQPTR